MHFSKMKIVFAISKFSKFIFFSCDSESAPQKTAYKPVYEIDFEKNPKTGPPYCFISQKWSFGIEKGLFLSNKMSLWNKKGQLMRCHNPFKAKRAFSNPKRVLLEEIRHYIGTQKTTLSEPKKNFLEPKGPFLSGKSPFRDKRELSKTERLSE